MRRLRKDGTPCRPNLWHVYLMDQYSCAAHAWWLEAERVTMLYDTELREHRQLKPQPQLRDFMVELSAVWRQSAAV